jgi:hypothetical protein
MSIEPSHILELNLPAVSRVARLREILVRNVRTQFSDYLRVFAGTGMRLGLQAVYFFVPARHGRVRLGFLDRHHDRQLRGIRVFVVRVSRGRA